MTIVAVTALLALAVTRRSTAQAPATSANVSASVSASANVTGSASATNGLVPPRLLSSPAVEYPVDANGDAVVVLLVTVDDKGAVESVAAVKGEDPFAAAAISAAKTWKFTPAFKDGKPIRSKTRFSVGFTAPKIEPAPIASPSASTSAAPATGGPPKVPSAEVVIEGTKLPPTVTSLSKVEVRELPGAFGDPFRAIEILPGVTPIVSGLPFFYVRGAPPGNVGYFLDGVRVPYLYHVGLGPSVIHPGMVDRVDLYPGGYPARFGRFAGGIVSGETAEPRHDFHGEGNIRLFDAGALVESGFADGKGSILLGGRYSYTALIVSLIAKDVQLDYRDFQARITYDVTDKDRLTAFSFGAYDLLGQKQNGILNILFGAEFYRLDLRWDHTFAKNTVMRYAVTLGWDQTHIADQRNATDKSLGSRLELSHEISKRTTFRAGVDFVLDAYQAALPTYADPENPDTQRFAALFPPRNDLAGGVWSDFVFKPDDNVEITPGVRADFFKSGTATKQAVDPRLSMRFKVSKDVSIIHAYGLAHQPPSFFVPVPGLAPGSLGHGLQTAFQTSAGVEVSLPWEVTGTVTGFHNAFFGMTDAIGSSNRGFDAALEDIRASGRAFGGELFLRKRLTKNLGGFLSYTISRSTRTLDGRTYPATFDRTHVASLAVAYDLGRKWRIGTRFVFYTGAPKVVQQHGLLAPPPTLSPDRDPAFYRVDLRLEKRWNFGEKMWLSFVVEFLNATLHKEVVQGQEIGPVTIPSIGVEGGF